MTDCLYIHHKLNTCGFKEARGGYSQKHDCERSTVMGELFAVGHCETLIDVDTSLVEPIPKVSKANA